MIQIWRFSLLVLLSSLECPPPPPRTFLIGGTPVPPTNATWQALLWNNSDDRRYQIVCGAILVKHRYVLTAAHCVYGFTHNHHVSSRYVIKMGTHKAVAYRAGQVTRNISRVYIHPEYDNVTLDNDIALIRLEEPVDYVPGRISPIQLARAGSSDMCLELPNEGLVLMTGWGRKNVFNDRGAKNLQGLRVPVTPYQACKQAFPDFPVTENMVCVGSGDGKDACHGDSGGPAAAYNPITDKWTLMGVISWGNRLCGTPGSYTVLARASRYVRWMSKTIAEDRSTPKCL